MYIHGPCDLFAVCRDLSAPVCQVFIAKMGWDAFGKADFETFQKAVAPWNYFILGSLGELQPSQLSGSPSTPAS